VRLRFEDTTISFPHAEGFSYRPFWKLWLVPRDWEGRMEVMPLGPEAMAALLLGENGSFRVLARSLGRNDWPEGADLFATALGLSALRVGPRPLHTIDAAAMQRLYLRLDSATGGRAARWHRQVYGIARLDDLVYVELLTWDDRGADDSGDATSLGPVGEAETRFLGREAFAAFPEAQALYLRRVTEGSFSDLLMVKERTPAATSARAERSAPGARPGTGRAPCDGS